MFLLLLRRTEGSDGGFEAFGVGFEGFHSPSEASDRVSERDGGVSFVLKSNFC